MRVKYKYIIFYECVLRWGMSVSSICHLMELRLSLERRLNILIGAHMVLKLRGKLS